MGQGEHDRTGHGAGIRPTLRFWLTLYWGMAPARLSLTSSNPARSLPRAVREGVLVGDIHGLAIRKVIIPLSEVADQVGAWLLTHELYSQGNDFTSEDAKTPGHVGNSTLRSLWKGSPTTCEEGMDTIELYLLLKKGAPCGVIAWVRPEQPQEHWFDKRPDHPNHHPKWRVPVGRLGNLMAYLTPDIRGKGICRQVVRDLVMPRVRAEAQRHRQQGRIPLVGAADAMNSLVNDLGDLPVTPYLGLCRAMEDDLWRVIERQRMAPERRVREWGWLVERQACPRARPKLRA